MGILPILWYVGQVSISIQDVDVCYNTFPKYGKSNVLLRATVYLFEALLLTAH